MNAGRCNNADLLYEDIKLFKRYCNFISPVGRCCDIGPTNAKIEYIKKHFGIDVKQIDSGDFNFDCLSGKFDTVFCFEILEHLQNPLHFMRQVSNLIALGGSLYLSSPGRWKFLWTERHFREYTPKELQTWILDECGLKIHRKRKARISPSWRYWGIRPLIRLITNNTWIYEIKHHVLVMRPKRIS